MDALPSIRQQKHISGTENYTDMGLDEVSTADHAHWITPAKDGSRGAATILMSEAAICIQHGIPLPEPQHPGSSAPAVLFTETYLDPD